jgi:sensor histidine kinase YesM
MKLFQSYEKYLGFDDRPMVLIGIPVITFIAPVLFFGASYDRGFLEICPELGSSLVYTTILWFGNRRVLIELRKRIAHYKERKRIIYTVIAVIIFTTIVNLTGYYLTPEEQRLYMQGEGFGSGIFITLFVITIYEAVWASTRFRRAQMEAEQLKHANLQGQMNTLKSQINPHFLFNSLNTLISLIPENPDKAELFAQKLSDTYRAILKIKEREVVPLRDELECLESYTFLLNTRFGEAFQLKCEVDDRFMERYIVPLSLQILLENAIKHNIVSRSRPLTVEVFVNDDENLVVRNNLQPKLEPVSSTGTGLQNIDERFTLVAERSVEVVKTDASFTVVLPLLNIQDYAHPDR